MIVRAVVLLSRLVARVGSGGRANGSSVLVSIVIMAVVESFHVVEK